MDDDDDDDAGKLRGGWVVPLLCDSIGLVCTLLDGSSVVVLVIMISSLISAKLSTAISLSMDV